MIGYHDFIVHIPEKYSPTFKTKSGLELHADRRHSLKLVANTIVRVVEVPFGYDGPVQQGDNVFIDPSVLMQQLYTKTGESPNIYLIDQKKKLYKADPNLVLAYYKNNKQWIGLNGNVFVKRIPMPKLTSKILDVVDHQNSGLNDDIARKGEIIIPMDNHACKKGATVWFRNLYSVDMWFDGVEYVNVRDKDLLAEEIAA